MNAPEPSSCRSCGAAIYWCEYVKKDGTPGKMPVDVEPVANGNVQLFRRGSTIRATVLSKEQAQNLAASAAVLGAELRLRLNHFVTCIHRDEHRRAS